MEYALIDLGQVDRHVSDLIALKDEDLRDAIFKLFYEGNKALSEHMLREVFMYYMNQYDSLMSRHGFSKLDRGYLVPLSYFSHRPSFPIVTM